jgi:outer membrane protein assembly factor BamD
LHPRHPNVDYAFYIKGLAKFNNDKDLFASAPFLGEMTHKRELSEAKESFEDLSDFITRFPESEYAGNARQRMIYLRNLIAKQEIYIAEFYIERKAFVAALTRADYVLKYMPKTPQVERALEIMIIAYQELGQDNLKADVEEALKTFKKNLNPS